MRVLILALSISSIFAMGRKSLIPIDAQHPYYTLEILEVFDGKQENVKAFLHKVLNSHHMIRPPLMDSLVDSCGNEVSCYGPRKLSYKEARKNLFGDIHLEKDSSNSFFIKDIYCLKEYTNKDFPSNKGIGEFLIPEHTILNTEHVYPKYRFLRNESGLPKSERSSDPLYKWKEADLHILYPSNSKDNSIRGNYQLGEVSEETKQTVCDGTKLGYITKLDGSLSSTLYFEPPNESKGNTARAIFYFSVRYNVPIHADEEAFLRAWHKADPVDEIEHVRNNKIFFIQKVRNPFIDMPQLVESITDF